MTSAIQLPGLIIGLMSGTSADGVDAALLYTDGRDVVRAHGSLFVPYTNQLRADILALMRGVGDSDQVARDLTDVHIAAVNQLIAQEKIARDTVALVGFHGQTIRHSPHEGITLQIGEPERMARELGIPVVADFRTADVKAGGQGAPLVPLYHAALAHSLEKPLMVVNIGGVSNVTWIGESREAWEALSPCGRGLGEGASNEAPNLIAPSSRPSPARGEGALASPPPLNIIAFDSGPGNALIDDWVFQHTGKRYDENGEIAAMGMVDSDALGAFLRDPYFAKDAPKSLDRLHFNPRIHGSLEDGAATLTAMTASSIALSCSATPEVPKRLLITGGGRHNPTLMTLLRGCVTMPVEAVEAVGWDGDMLEAQAFAYLAARSVQGLPLSLPTTTGVKEPITGGKLFDTNGS